MAQFFNLNPTGVATARLSEAEGYYLAGNLNEGLAAAQQAWREYPQEPDVYRVLAYLHMSRGEYPPAAQAAYRAVELDPGNAASYAILGQVYLTFGLMPQAEQTLATALQQFPQDAMLLAELADLRFRRQQLNAAVLTAQQALQANPEDGYTSALLGMHYLKKRKFHQAVPLLRSAVRIYPFRPDYLRDFGIAAFKMNDMINAEWGLRESLKHGPDDEVTKRYLHQLLVAKRRNDMLGCGLTLYFHDYSGFGWFLIIMGILLLLIGLIVTLVAALDTTAKMPQWIWGGGLLIVGFGCLFFPWPGLRMSRMKGKKLTGLLRQELSKADVGQ